MLWILINVDVNSMHAILQQNLISSWLLYWLLWQDFFENQVQDVFWFMFPH